MKLQLTLVVTGLLIGCGAPNHSTPDDDVETVMAPAENGQNTSSDSLPTASSDETAFASQLNVHVSYEGRIEGRLTVALFPGEDPWGWSQDLRQLSLPNFPESVRFERLAEDRYTVLAILDAVPFDATNPGPEDRVVSVSLSLDQDENDVQLLLPEEAAEVAPEPEVPVYDLTAAFSCNCETLRDLTVTVHQNAEAPFRSREVINPVFPGVVDFNDLPAGGYRIRWSSTSLGGVSGERDWTVPSDGDRIEFQIEIPEPPPTPEPILEDEEPENADPADDDGEQEPELVAVDEGEDAVDLEEEIDFPNEADNAQGLAVGTRVLGNLDGFRDFDWFRFTVEETSNLSIGTVGTTDTRCLLKDVDGNQVAEDDDSGEGSNCWLNLEELRPGTYLLRISHYSWWGTGEYLLVSSWLD